MAPLLLGASGFDDSGNPYTSTANLRALTLCQDVGVEAQWSDMDGPAPSQTGQAHPGKDNRCDRGHPRLRMALRIPICATSLLPLPNWMTARSPR